MAVATPFTALAARRLEYDLAKACHIQVPAPRRQKARLVTRRPKMFEHGTIRKLENPSARTQTPVMRLCWVGVMSNSFAKSGNMGPIDRADSTETNKNKNWVVITRSKCRLGVSYL